MGRYSVLLSPQLADLAGVQAGQRVLDVGCGPGALTTELVTRLGRVSVAAADPSEPFVEAARARHPGVEVVHAPAEHLPFDDDCLRCRARPARRPLHVGPGRRPARDGPRHATRRRRRRERLGSRRRRGTPRLFWDAVREIDPTVHDESRPGRCPRGPPGRVVRGRGPARRSRRPWSRRISNTPRSMRGGSRSRSASGRPGRTWSAWIRQARPTFESDAERASRERTLHDPGPRLGCPGRGLTGSASFVAEGSQAFLLAAQDHPFGLIDVTHGFQHGRGLGRSGQPPREPRPARR